MPQVARDVAKDRARRLREAGAAALARHLDGEVGRRRRVLTETADTGRTEHFMAVRFEAPVAPGRIVEAFVRGHDGTRLIAASSGIVEHAVA
jgi:threonylcarbamoyladenosine tRNA methylthiotransferase MtaB